MSTHSHQPAVLRMTKHHGAGNDFLVVVDPDGRHPLDAEVVRALCHRRLGVGADGVIRVLAGQAESDLTMELRNADGGTAEMSGNGMRCLAQAAVESGLAAPPRFSVSTPAGVRTVEYRPGDAPGTAEVSVDMGRPELGDDPVDLSPAAGTGLVAERSRYVDLGNPHLVVLVADLDEVAVAEAGAALQCLRPDGVNVEFIALEEAPDVLRLRVWERGAGLTQACGTGSAAAAAAASGWGLVGDRVSVHNPGGTLEVRLAPGGARLSGPVRKVADVEVAVDQLLGSARR